MKNNFRTARLNSEKGFTLLELLIVIAILVVLSVIVVLVLNPAETLRKSRDAQRISDLATVKSALGLYLTSTSTPLLDNTSGNPTCKNGSGTKTLYYSAPTATDITDATLDGGIFTANGQAASPGNVDGTGWIPVNLASLTGGAPVSNFPVDPVNTATSTAALANIVNAASFYRYACDASDLTFEINTILESSAYTTGTDNRLTADGGNNSNLYEVGTKLTVLGAGNDF